MKPKIQRTSISKKEDLLAAAGQEKLSPNRRGLSGEQSVITTIQITEVINRKKTLTQPGTS